MYVTTPVFHFSEYAFKQNVFFNCLNRPVSLSRFVLFHSSLSVSNTPIAGKDAGDTYTKLAEVNLKLESQHDSASAWVEAAKAYQKCDEKSEFSFLSLSD